jgi:hypothetical protein
MATQLGEAQIDSIEGPVVRGSFKSVNEKNVHRASPGWGASLLYDAFSSLVGQTRDESVLLTFIKSVHFATPNQPRTEFTIEVTDPAVLAGLTSGYWESYYLG